ncbi:DNA ligase 4-like [Actinia tenebrosa]|uniref:DNA ligase 4 n=1 Tax=Actinia tenebrosa TaxID=6105 RepID=A0A6P8J0X6_ACTTE|nr:DNA ligase 4-like [Actinia tenebrosa]
MFENETDSLYPGIRLLLPHLDKDRPAYGMKEVVLARYYIEILSIGKDSTDGRKLLNYRHPGASKQGALGDFASVAYFVLKNRCPEKGSFNVEQINKHLDDIAQANLEKKRDEVKKSLQILLRNTTAMEQKWLIRIILRELKTGLSENSVLGVFHSDALELYNICNSLSKVCQDLHNPTIRMNEVEISLFSPFRPMLGQRGSLNQVEKVMEGQPFYIEEKVDGERMQLHKGNNTYKYFSRSANEYTHIFGESADEGFLTPHIAESFNSSTESCILDGEMVIFDPSAGTFFTKATNHDVKSASTYDKGFHPCFIVFDILLLNDRKLANVSLQERIAVLNTVFNPRLGYIQFVERKNGTSKTEIISALNEAIDRREEGLVIKAPSSVYKPNVRNGSGWLKIKPEYVDSLSDELDVLIVGGYFGVGIRSGMISHFLCAVAVPPDQKGQHPSQFYSFCKVGTGYTLDELRELGNKLKPHWQPFKTNKPPQNIALAPGFKEKPDVWIEPSKSKIVQIKAAEIIASDRYKTGSTLRFPRLECIRDDKHWYECLDLKELEKLRTMAEGKLTYQHTDMDGTSEPTRKKRRVAARVEQPRTVAAHFRPADVSSVTEVSKLFAGKEFCIINGPTSEPKAQLEKKVVEHGGTFTQNPGPETYCVIAERVNLRVNNIIKDAKHDVVKASWLIDCLNQVKLLPWLPIHMIHRSPTTEEKFAMQYDSYGDSFTQDATQESLKKVFGSFENQEKATITTDEIAEIEQRYFPDQCPLGLFRGSRIYLDQFKSLDDPNTAIKDSSLELTALQLRFYGASIISEFDEIVTHVVFDERDLTRLPELRQIMRSRQQKHHFVTQDWVTQSIEKGQLLQERPFAPVPSV